MSQPCSRCGSPLEPEDLRCAICGLPTPGDQQVPAHAMAQILRCEECGAAVSFTIEAGAPRCAFCRAVMRIEVPADPVEQAEGYLPFVVSPAAAEQALRGWLGTLGFFRPSDLQRSASVAGLQPLWWVGWSFDAEALVSWAADSNAGAHRSAWAPHAGQQPLNLQRILVSASRGLSTTESTALAPYFDAESAQPAPHGPPSAVIERFDVQRSAARHTIVQAIEALAAARASRWIPGSRYRKLHVAVLLRALATRRLALPSYVLCYRYRNKAFRAVVHGQRADCVIGRAPYSVAKIVATAVAALVSLVLAALVASR